MGVRECPELNKRRCLKEEKQRLWNWTVSKSLFVILFVYRIILIFLKLLTTLSFHWKHIVLVCTWYHFKHEISFYYMILLQPQIQSAWLYDSCESFVDDFALVVIFLIIYFVWFYFARRPFYFSAEFSTVLSVCPSPSSVNIFSLEKHIRYGSEKSLFYFVVHNIYAQYYNINCILMNLISVSYYNHCHEERSKTVKISYTFVSNHEQPER